MKVETYIITSISAIMIGQAVVLVIMHDKTFKTVFIGNIIMCMRSH